ncbi:MAG: 50S ribosomal protein L3 [Acidobacteriota bacterium]
MVEGLIGKKIGMTQVFDANGKVVPVTIIKAGPCVVVQKKTVAKDGYEKVQLGFVDQKKKVRVNKPMEGHFKKANVPPTAKLQEFAYTGESDGLKVGDNILPGDLFTVGSFVNVVGKSKGRGFQGVIKRYGFGGGKASHGSMFHRAPGSIGASASPSRVVAGMKNPGQMGNVNVNIQDLEIIDIDVENNLLLVKGSVPGSRDSFVTITKAF